MDKISRATGIMFSGPICNVCIQGFGGIHKKQITCVKMRPVSLHEMDKVIKTGDYFAYETAARNLDANLNSVDKALKAAIERVHDLTKIRNGVLSKRNEIRILSDDTENGKYFARRYKASRHINKPEIRCEVLAKGNYQCKKCGVKSDLTIDHILSVFSGGGNEMENLQVLCRRCNSSKGKN